MGCLGIPRIYLKMASAIVQACLLFLKTRKVVAEAPVAGFSRASGGCAILLVLAMLSCCGRVYLAWLPRKRAAHSIGMKGTGHTAWNPFRGPRW